MDKHTYQKWWAIHLRASRGENLAEEERAFYEAELRKLQKEEIMSSDSKALREAQRKAASLTAEHDQMQARRDKLETEIRALEAVMAEKSQLIP